MYIDDTAAEFERQCKPENVTADLKKVDAFYAQANLQLCTVDCPCDAGKFKIYVYPYLSHLS